MDVPLDDLLAIDAGERAFEGDAAHFRRYGVEIIIHRGLPVYC
jgi:hypothetical protein